MSNPNPPQNVPESTSTKSSPGDEPLWVDPEAGNIPRLVYPQSVVKIEIYRPAKIIYDWEAADDIYSIHRDFLRHHSYLFRKQYDARRKHTNSPNKLSVAFPDFSALERFIEFAYAGKIDTTTGKWTQRDILFLWIFAAKIGAPKLQNYAILQLHEMRKGGEIGLVDDEMLGFLSRQEGVEELKRYITDTAAGVVPGLMPDHLVVMKKEGVAVKTDCSGVGKEEDGGGSDIKNYFVDMEEVARKFLNDPSAPWEVPVPPPEIVKPEETPYFDGPGGSWSHGPAWSV